MDVADSASRIGIIHDVHMVRFLLSVVKPDYNLTLAGPPATKHVTH